MPDSPQTPPTPDTAATPPTPDTAATPSTPDTAATPPTPDTAAPPQKDLLISLENVTPKHGRRHQQLYFVLLVENLSGQPATTSLTMNPALTAVMPGRGETESADSELSDWVNAFVSPVFTMQKNEEKTFLGGFPLYAQKPPNVVTIYLSVMLSHGREREIGTTLANVMTAADGHFHSLATDAGTLASARTTLKRDEAPPTPSTTTTIQNDSGTPAGGTSTDSGPTHSVDRTTTITPTAASTLVSDAAAAVSPVATLIQQAASTTFAAIGAALEGRGDRELYSGAFTLRSSDTPPYQAGTLNRSDDRVAMTLKIEFGPNLL